MITTDTLLEIATLAGAETPAFLALWNQVLQGFSSLDQQQLRAALERAEAASDAQHAEAQATVAPTRGK